MEVQKDFHFDFGYYSSKAFLMNEMHKKMPNAAPIIGNEEFGSTRVVFTPLNLT